MPKVFDEGGFRFFFYAEEGREPPHVHVEREDREAKFWLSPVRVASNDGLSARELNQAQRIAIKKEKTIKEKWDEFLSRKT